MCGSRYNNYNGGGDGGGGSSSSNDNTCVGVGVWVCVSGCVVTALCECCEPSGEVLCCSSSCRSPPVR